MSGAGLARGRPRTLALAFVAAVGVGALDGYALSVGAVHGESYLWAGPAASIPVALLVAWRSLEKPAAAMLAIVGLLTFSIMLTLTTTIGITPQDLPVAVAAVIAGGLVLVTARLAGLTDIIEGIILAYAGSAFIFEFAIVLHNV